MGHSEFQTHVYFLTDEKIQVSGVTQFARDQTRQQMILYGELPAD